MVFEIGIGTSQNWDPKKAILEAIKQAKPNLSKDPSFILFFSTIHYEKNKGFQKALDTIYSQIPKKTPLVGGTVAGFMNDSGTYTQGITLLLCYSDEIKISLGVGRNVRRNPKKAAKNCTKMIKKNIKSTHGAIFSFYSSAVVPIYPLLGQKPVITSKYLSIATNLFYNFSLKILQKGIDRSDECLNYITSELPEFKLIAGGCTDDVKQKMNKVFFNNSLSDNAIVALVIETEIETLVQETSGFKLSGIKLSITKKGKENRSLIQINNQPAKQEFLRIIGWPIEYLNDYVFSKIFWYPVKFCGNGANNLIQVFGLFVQNEIIMPYKIENDKLEILTADGKSILAAAIENINIAQNNKSPKFIFVTECALRPILLGHKLHQEQQQIKAIIKAPFLSIFVAGETIYDKQKGLIYGNSTFKSIVFN
ncbi:MAG: FIST N-terminal domain-containing protein [archaeon]